jgi:hypothetical protein
MTSPPAALPSTVPVALPKHTSSGLSSLTLGLLAASVALVAGLGFGVRLLLSRR